MILGAAYRSISLKEEGILVGQGKVITMEDAHRAGLGEIFDRVVVELVGKMEEMKMVSYFSKIYDLLSYKLILSIQKITKLKGIESFYTLWIFCGSFNVTCLIFL